MGTVSCSDYRLERRLLAIERRLADKDLPADERAGLEEEKAELERSLGMD